MKADLSGDPLDCPSCAGSGQHDVDIVDRHGEHDTVTQPCGDCAARADEVNAGVAEDRAEPTRDVWTQGEVAWEAPV